MSEMYERGTVKSVNLQGRVFNGFPTLGGGPILSESVDLDISSEVIVFFDESTQSNNKILVVRNCFSEEEIATIIDVCENALKFEDLSQLYSPSYRNNTRVMVDDDEFVGVWDARLQPHIAKYIEAGKEDVDEPESWASSEPVGMNNRLRICKYPSGGIFKKHADAQAFLPGKISYLTVMAYLNDIPREFGGATRFFQKSAKSRPSNDHNVLASVQPEKGLVVIFPHHLYHDGDKMAGEINIIVVNPLPESFNKFENVIKKPDEKLLLMACTSNNCPALERIVFRQPSEISRPFKY